MQYTISYANPNQHLVDIVLTLTNVTPGKTTVVLPSWRPGRYELGGFIENVQKFDITDVHGNQIDYQKIAKDQWCFHTESKVDIIVSYNYFAFKMDAGSSYLDESQLYLNFINCLIYDPNRLNDDCSVHLVLPKNYKVACGLSSDKAHILNANSFYHLVESPMIASAELNHFQYECNHHQFHLWFMGDFSINWEKLKPDFLAFTKNQIEMMGNFPCEHYHFLIQLLPYPIYHGVEHYNSTVIALGPGQQINEGKLYEDLLGVSSHELFHTWNVIRIKPKEFLPYDFTKENYFFTGFVAEGFTTYYGDLFLARSNVFSQTWYFNELNKQLDRHLNNAGRFNLSLAASSFDLWIDGYKKGIPDRKVSIYTKGALVALLFDLNIRSHTNNDKSLDDVLIKMWQAYGDMQSGYSSSEILDMINDVAGNDLSVLFDHLIYKCTPLEQFLETSLDYIGCELKAYATTNRFEYAYGFKGTLANNSFVVSQIFPHSQAAEKLSLNDEIIAVNGQKLNVPLNTLISDNTTICLNFFRNGKLHETTLQEGPTKYYKTYKLEKKDNPTEQEHQNFKAWLHS